MLLAICTLLIGLIPLLASAAPVLCDFACPTVDNTGHTLITSPYATSYTAPYSIFDCVYSLPASPTGPHICHYYKSDGRQALGSPNDPCPPQAVSCSAVETPRFSAPEKMEVMPWVVNGNDLLYYKEHHPTS